MANAAIILSLVAFGLALLSWWIRVSTDTTTVAYRWQLRRMQRRAIRSPSRPGRPRLPGEDHLRVIRRAPEAAHGERDALGVCSE